MSTYSSAKTVSSSYVLCTMKSMSSASDIEPPRAPPPSAPWVHPSIATGTMVLVRKVPISKQNKSRNNFIIHVLN